MIEKKFRVQDDKNNDVMGGLIDEGHAYIQMYGALVKGRQPNLLEVDESCTKEFALSGQKATRYIILRVE